MPSAFRKYSRAAIRHNDGTEIEIGEPVEVTGEAQPAITPTSSTVIDAAHEQLKRLGLLGEANG